MVVLGILVTSTRRPILSSNANGCASAQNIAAENESVTHWLNM